MAGKVKKGDTFVQWGSVQRARFSPRKPAKVKFHDIIEGVYD